MTITYHTSRNGKLRGPLRLMACLRTNLALKRKRTRAPCASLESNRTEPNRIEYNPSSILLSLFFSCKRVWPWTLTYRYHTALQCTGYTHVSAETFLLLFQGRWKRSKTMLNISSRYVGPVYVIRYSICVLV